MNNNLNYDLTDYAKNIQNKEYKINSGDSFDAIVVGAGHAGCEACLALARMGHKTLIINEVLLLMNEQRK